MVELSTKFFVALEEVLCLEIVGACIMANLASLEPVKGKRLARKQEIKKCLSSGTDGHQFSFFEFKI